MMNKSIIAAIACGVLSPVFATFTMAAEAASTPSVAVQYGDLDLQSGSGRQILDQRLRQAARSVCAGNASKDLGTRLEGKRCMRQAIGRARIEVSEQQVARTAEGQASPG